MLGDKADEVLGSNPNKDSAKYISKRGQEHLVPVALRKIGCTYMAFQLDCYFKR